MVRKIFYLAISLTVSVAASQPVYYNLEKPAQMLYEDGCRWIDMGDSFRVHYLPGRTSYGSMLVDSRIPVTAVSVGSFNSGNAFIRTNMQVQGRLVHGPTHYQIHEGVNAYWGLPIKAVWEVVDDVPEGWTTVSTTKISNGALANYGSRIWVSTSANIMVRPMFLGSAEGYQAQRIRIDGEECDLTTNCLDTFGFGIGTPIEPLHLAALSYDVSLGNRREFDD